MRKKPARTMNTEVWADTAFSSLADALELYRGRTTFSGPHSDRVDGRPAFRYELGLSAEAAQPPPDGSAAIPHTLLPLAPMARWRELSAPLDLDGELWVDAATAVPLKAHIVGRLEVHDRKVRSTQLAVRYDSEITQVGRVKPLGPPKHVDEFIRKTRPRDPLDFFRSELPAAATAPTAQNSEHLAAEPGNQAQP
jgi:hypothetical protein